MRSRSLHAVHLVAAASAVVALGVLLNCGDVVPNLENGARCSLNSDCKAPLVCGFERCRAQCKTSRDCGGKLCVRGQDGASVCQLDDEVECSHNSECPGSQLCGPDRHCRDVCITDKDCVTDLLCVSRVCAKPEELVNGTLPQKSPADAGASCTYATDCPGDLVCLYGRCDVECLGDKDCLVGWSCKPTARGGDGRCYPNKSESDAGPDATLDASLNDASADAAQDAAIDAGDGSADASDAGTVFRPIAIGGGLGTCVTFSDGTAKCFGSNTNGQLGLGDTQTRGDAPGEMGNALPFVALGTGVLASEIRFAAASPCARMTSGKVKCWGQNTTGQLGIGDGVGRGGAAGQMGDNLPFVNLGTGRTAKFVTSGTTATCAILDNDQLKCWGGNTLGVLGLGDGIGRGGSPGDMGDNLPYVNLGAGRTVRAVGTQGIHACAILDNGGVKCWGANSNGELGLGDTMARGSSPAHMGDNLPYVDLGAGRTAKTLAVTDGHACVILDNDRVKCWGGGGVLGLGDGERRGDGPNEMGDNLPYVDLGTGRTAKFLSASGSNTCVILDNDQLKCWGAGSLGTNGQGETGYRGLGPNQMGDNLPNINLGTGRTARVVSVGFYTVCVILDDDGVKCWGYNALGNLGLGDTQNRGDAPGEMGDNLPYVKLVGP